ncbi:MAG: hypothetical protein IK115_12545 [Lachnospiraceae bacterium]|nr:hypothetical protein [Lachnospiraceae bacterium]
MRYKDLHVAWAYFFIHLLVELVCFTLLFRMYSLKLAWTAAIVYDLVAFVPQGLIGEFIRRHPRFDIGSTGVLFMTLSLFLLPSGIYALHILGIVSLAFGNALLHEAGAVACVAAGDGKLFHSALFVGGGSFGVVIGKTIAAYGFSLWFLLIPLALTGILCFWIRKEGFSSKTEFPLYKICNERYPGAILLLAAFFVTTARSFIAYAIPISWKKEVWQSFVLFFLMGMGKALGGYFADRFGARRTGVLSSLLCIPFLLAGKDHMLVSVIGVFLFSMTMSITFAMCLSVLPDAPGVAFGITTFALFAGLMIPFCFGDPGAVINTAAVIVLSLVSALLLYQTTIDKEEKKCEQE